MNSGQIPFTDPGQGCYYVALVLEQQVNGVWQTEDYGNFSKRISSGQGCLFSFTADPTSISPGGSSTLQWTTGGTGVTIDNGVGAKPPNGSSVVNPAQTTTYTLTVNGTADSSPRTGQVTVNVQAPTITFSAAPASIITGQSSTLTWSTTNATSVTIDNGVGAKPVSGTVSVSPSQTATYTLTATGPGGTATKQTTVTVTQPPPIIAFSANPSTISTGQSSTLQWSTTNATSIAIDNGVGAQPASGSVSVHPTQTTTYTLTATGSGGTATRQATVTVSTGPSISFSAVPVSIAAGESSTLTWMTTNATSVSIDQGVGSQPVNGSVSVAPDATTMYTLTATGPGGTATAQATVVVELPPTVLSFFAQPQSIAPGGRTTLSWMIHNSSRVQIEPGIGAVTPLGSRNVSPAATTVYVLFATGPGGTVSRSVTVTVIPAKRRAARH